MSEYQPKQLELPLAIRRKSEVSWLNIRLVEKSRIFGLLGKKMLSEFIPEVEGEFWPSKTTIDIETINDLKDPDLRYALRFADAAHAAGWKEDSWGHSGNLVIVQATDEGPDSRFIRATYDGKLNGGVDPFMENLIRFAPDQAEITKE